MSRAVQRPKSIAEIVEENRETFEAIAGVKSDNPIAVKTRELLEAVDR